MWVLFYYSLFRTRFVLSFVLNSPVLACASQESLSLYRTDEMDPAGRVCLSLTLNWGSPDFNEPSIINIIHGNWSINWYILSSFRILVFALPWYPAQKQICCDNTWLNEWFSKFMTTIEFDCDSRCTSPLLIIMLIIFAHCCRLQWPAHYPSAQSTRRDTPCTLDTPHPPVPSPDRSYKCWLPAWVCCCRGLVPAKPGQQRQEIVRQEWGQAQLSSSSYLPGTASQWRGPSDPSLATERALLGSAGHGTVRMAVLTDGQKFGLSSKSQTNKSVICVKLTDSALRSLEEYLKNKVSYI